MNENNEDRDNQMNESETLSPDSAQDKDSLSAENLGWGKLAFLGGISILLTSIGLYTGLIIFAPVPLAMAILLFGRSRTLMMVVVSSIAVFFFLQSQPEMAVLSTTAYLTAYVIACCISEIILRNIPPMRGLLKFGAGLFVVVVLILAALISNPMNELDMSLVEYINHEVVLTTEKVVKLVSESSGNPSQVEAIKVWASRPELITKAIVEWSFATVFMAVFVGLWAGLFLVLRNSLLWKIRYAYSYDLRDLTSFRMPDYYIWPVILGLVLVVGESHFSGTFWSAVGGNILFCLGVFFFFQGFGVFLKVLSKMKIYGFLRTFLIIITLFVATRLVALVGLFDVWINFRKLLKDKSNEGEQI